MAFVRVAINAMVLLQLLLVCSSIAVYGDEAPYKPPTYPPIKPPVKPPVKPPTPPPVKPPVQPPVKPPTPPPVKPPVEKPVKPPTPPPVKPPIYPPPKKIVAVQGVVYCKPCKYIGVDTLNGAAPLFGAVVKLQCNNAKYGNLVEQTKTDKNGYFLFMSEKLKIYDYHMCKVYLVSSPLSKCSVPTNLNGGIVGAVLTPAPETKKQPLVLFNVGPFAFEPHKFKCPYY